MKTLTKRVSVLFLACAMALSMAACSGGSRKGTTSSSRPTTSQGSSSSRKSSSSKKNNTASSHKNSASSAATPESGKNSSGSAGRSSSGIGLRNVDGMMRKMGGSCAVEQSGGRFCAALYFACADAPEQGKKSGGAP